MILICFLGIFCGLGRSQHLSRVPIAQVSITNPGERGLIPAQPYWPPSRPTLTTPRPAPTPPPVSPHTNAHLNEIESGVHIQDHGNRKTPEGARKSLPAVVLHAQLADRPPQLTGLTDQPLKSPGETSTKASPSLPVMSERQQSSGKNLLTPTPAPIATHLLSFASLHSGMPEINLSQESRGEVQPSLLAHGQTSMPFQLPIINREQSQDHQLFRIKQAEPLNAPEHTAQTENLKGKLSSGNVSTHSNVDHHGTKPHLKSSLSQLNFGGTHLPSVPHSKTSLSNIPRVHGAAVSHLVPVDEAGELPPLHHRSILPASQLHESDTLTPAPHSVPQSSPAAQFTITPHSPQDPFYYFNYPFNAFHNPIIGSQVPAVHPEQEAGAPHQVPGHPPSQLHHAPPKPQHQPQTPAHHLNVPQELPQQLTVHPLVIQTPQNHTQASVLENKLLSSQLAKPITHKTDSPRSGDENLRGSLLLPDPKQFDEFGQVFEYLNQNIGKETIKINSNENNNDYDYYYYDDYEDYKEHTETPDKPPAATPTHPTNVSGRTQQPHWQRHPTTRRSKPRKPITPPPSFIPPRPGHARITHALNPQRPGNTPGTTTRAHVHQDLSSMEGNHHPEDESHPTRPLSSHTNTTRPSSVSSEDVTLGIHNISLGKPLNRLTSPLNKSRQSFSEQPAEPRPTTPQVRDSAPATITTSMTRQKSTKLRNLPPLYEPSTHSREGEGKLTLGESQESTSNSTAPQKALNHRRRPVSVEIATIVGTGGHVTLLASPEQLLKLQASREVPIQATKARQPVYFLPTEVGQQAKLAQRKRDVGHSSGSQQDIFITHLRKRRPQRPQISSDESQPILRDTRLFAPPPNTKRRTLGKLFVPEYTQHNTQVKMGQINKADVDGQHTKTNTTRVHAAASNRTSGHWQRHIRQPPVSSRSEPAVEGATAAAGRHQPKLSSSFTRTTLVPSPSVAPKVTFLTHVSNKNMQLKYNREHNISAGSSFHRLPLLGLTGEEALAQYKDLQDADPPTPSLDSLPPVLEKVVTASPPFNRARVSIGADGMLRAEGWKKDMPYPYLNMPASSLAVSGLPFYTAQQHNLEPFFMVSL